jgi:hypothetical protein
MWFSQQVNIMLYKVTLFIILFLLFIPFVYASEVKVSYFFGSKCEASRVEEGNISKVKSYWEGRVDWKDYDLDDKSNIDVETKYKIWGIPAAVVECLNKTIKIDRKNFYFAQEINQTIYGCYAEGLKTRLPTETFVLLILGIVLGLYLLRKKIEKKKKRKRVRKS